MKVIASVVILLVSFGFLQAQAPTSKIALEVFQDTNQKLRVFPGGTLLPKGWKLILSQGGPPPIIGRWVQVSLPFFTLWPNANPVAGEPALYGLAKIEDPRVLP